MSDRATHSDNSRASTPDSIAPAPTAVARDLRPEVYKKQLTGIEQAVILAMLEGDPTGKCLKISIPRIAAWSKLDEKTVQRALWGDHRTHPNQPKPKREKGKPEPECPHCKGLVQRRVLHQTAPARWKEHRPARYELILDILDDAQDVRHYLDQRHFDFPPPLGKRPTVASPQRPTVASPSVPRSHGLNLDDDRLDHTLSVDSQPQANRESGHSASSSDDDVARVLHAFEQSPITTGKAKLSDRATARNLLDRFTRKQIEYGILLAGVRRSTSALSQPALAQKVQSLAYFANAIAEAAENQNCSASYAQYLRHVLNRNSKDEFIQQDNAGANRAAAPSAADGPKSGVVVSAPNGDQTE